MTKFIDIFESRGLLGIVEELFNFRLSDEITFRLIALFFGLATLYISYKYITGANKNLKKLKDGTYELELKENESPEALIKILIKEFKSQKRIGYYIIIVAIFFLLSGLLP